LRFCVARQNAVYLKLIFIRNNQYVSTAMLQEHLTSPVTLNLAEDVRWQAIQRIVGSPRFIKSPRLTRLLCYLAEQALLNDSSQLSEHVLATRVFERDSSFDPAVDTIVRSHMVRLRQKLDRYAAEAGATSPIQVSIPKGEYAIRFDQLTPAPVRPTPEVRSRETLPVVQPRTAKPLLFLNWVSAILLLLGSAIFLFKQIHRSAANVPASARPLHPLWSRVFQPPQPTTFVAADSGLVLFHSMTSRSTTLAEYLGRDFSSGTRGLSTQRTAEALDMADRRYTSFVDLNLFHGLERLPAASSALDLKYARDLHMDDLKHGNFVFSGARGANPWLELYESGMNFVGSSNGVNHSYTFINRHPLAGEQPEYSVAENGPNRRVLGVLAFLSNLDSDGNVLIVEGDSMAGTEAISDFVLNDSALLPFLKNVSRPDGSASHFEVLLESHSVDGSAGPFHILAYRTHP
jgi:hypothetical protein